MADLVPQPASHFEAGFDGLEIHSANGYLIDQFLQSSSNDRADEHGGSLENRFRLLREIVEALIESGFPANRVGFRLSPNGVHGGMGSKDNFEMFLHVAEQLNKHGLAHMHVMDGLSHGHHGKSKALMVADFRKVWDGIIIANIGLTKEIAEGMVRLGAADMAAFGHLHISKPDLPEQFANNCPLAESAPHETWWKPTGAKGHADWKVHTLEKEDQNEKKDNQSDNRSLQNVRFFKTHDLSIQTKFNAMLHVRFHAEQELPNVLPPFHNKQKTLMHDALFLNT